MMYVFAAFLKWLLVYIHTIMGSPVKIKLPINKVLGLRKANKTPSWWPREKGVEESIN